MNEKWYLSLDVGGRRIGVAVGDNLTKIASPVAVVINDDKAIINIKKLTEKYRIEKIIIGLPRDNRGEETAQSKYVRKFAKKLKSLKIPLIFQDESLTSVEAEARISARGDKTSIDAEAATIILTDFLEAGSV